MKRNPRLRATYAPRDRSDLNAEAEEWIGWQGEWEVTHLLTEGDEETPTGTPMCAISIEQADPHPPSNAFIWVPISDLASVEWSAETLEEIAQEQRAVIARQRIV